MVWIKPHNPLYWMWFVLNDYESDYNDLLTKANVPCIKIMTLQQLAIEVYKSVTKINPEYLNELLLPKQCTYNLRNVSVLERPKVNATQFGLKSFKSYGPKIWNLLPNSYKKDISLGEFKNVIKSCDGPNCKCPVCNLYTWNVNIIQKIWTMCDQIN